MGDRYRTADVWTVEVVRLTATPDMHDGESIRVRYFGFTIRVSAPRTELCGRPRASLLSLTGT